MNMCIHTPVCAPVRVSARPPQPSRLSTVTHLALPTPKSHTPPSASPGQPPAWHSRGLLSVCKTMAGVPEVRRPPGTRFPPVSPSSLDTRSIFITAVTQPKVKGAPGKGAWGRGT